MKLGIVSSRVALLLRSAEIKPLFFDLCKHDAIIILHTSLFVSRDVPFRMCGEAVIALRERERERDIMKSMRVRMHNYYFRRAVLID